MKKFILIVMLAFLGACVNPGKEKEKLHDEHSSVNTTDTVDFKKNYELIIIDSCEYIIYDVRQNSGHGRAGYMSHKGNCKYCRKR